MAGHERPLSELPDPTVGLIMGSVSDARYVVPAEETLEYFGVPYETRVVSAHRTPDWMSEYAKTAVGRGLLAIITYAGGSSHLQGMTASETTLPVIGVAVESSPDAMNSSFGSQLRMPADGGPLAVAGKNEAGSTNAALLVVRFLAITYPELKPKLEERQEAIASKSLRDDAAMVRAGSAKEFLEEEEAETYG